MGVNNSPLMTYLGGGLFLLLVASVVCESKITDETSMGDGERAMKGLVAAKVKMEKKIDEMSNFIENELQVKEIQGTQFKRRKREADEGRNDNPLASLPQSKVYELLQAMNSMIEAFTDLTDKYNEKRNAEEALAEEALAEEEPVQNEEVVEEPDEVEVDPDEDEVDPSGEPEDPLEVDDPTPPQTLPKRSKPKRGPNRGHGNSDPKRRRRRRRRRRF